MRQRVGGCDRRLMEDGFTLTEMLVVLAVIGLIAAVLTPTLVGNLARARAKTAQLQLETIAAGVEMYRADVGRYPTDSEGLSVLVNQPADAEGWTGPYLKNARVLQDPWGNPVTYQVQGRAFLVRSFGADGAASGIGPDRDLTAPGQ